ncbi:trypsin-like peptidase domain-containing protein [Micromonospora humidisoli]|uniref:trypsin-like peptidase domain-containing protein n=1 Tax=Micromonospora sp. AKA109 TaxID=2733865 RepID=UPI002492BEA0|nr:trypsin-like peptidase domain-containing protein [Micromonospora sp. AKA109]
MPDDAELAVAGVRNAAGAVVGAAFLIDRHLLLTCTHVVRAALTGEVSPTPDEPADTASLSGGQVEVVFPLVRRGRPAIAVVLPPDDPDDPDDPGDVTVLRLVTPVPAGIRPVRLARPGESGTRDRVCRVFGFPGGKGRWFEGRVVGPVGGGWMQLANPTDAGYQIQPGYSGAPVWDHRVRCVVGMIVSADQRTRPQLEYPAAFMIPIRRLPVPATFGPPLVVTRWRQPFSRWRTGSGPPAGQLARPGTPAPAGTPSPDAVARPRRLRPGWIAALVAVLAGICMVAPEPLPGCPPAAELRVAVAPDDLLTYQTVAAAFQRSSAVRGCRTVNMFVYSASAEEVAKGLRHDWSASAGEPASSGRPAVPGWYPADVGPRPDVWFPGAEPLDDQLRNLDSVRDFETVAWSPLVLGVPRGLVDADRDDLDRQRSLSWPELFGKASRSATDPPVVTGGGRPVPGVGWQVVRPDPTLSPEARMVDVALYQDVGTTQLRRQVEQPLERTQDARGYPLGTLAAVLCRQRQLAQDPSAPMPPAVITTEQALVRFNGGHRLGDACAELGRPTPHRSLVAFYPKQTPGVEHRVVRLHWPDAVQSPVARSTADDFRRWLAGPGRDVLRTEGFRVAGRDEPGSGLTETNGVLPDWPLENPQWQLADAGDAAVLDTADRRYREARRPARVLLALDSSGSMLAPAGRGTRFDLAVDGVATALGQLGVRDEVGVWTFSTAYPGAAGRPRPVGPADPARDAALLARLRRTVPSGDTPLHRTIDDGVRELRRPGDPEGYLRALVVLTDGRDTASGDLVPRLDGQPPVRLYVLAVGEASCADRVRDRALRQAARSTGGECREVAAETIDQRLTELFAQLWEKGAEQ